MKQAFYADYIWYDSVLYEQSWLLTDNGVVEGIVSDESTLLSYKKTVFKNSDGVFMLEKATGQGYFLTYTFLYI